MADSDTTPEDKTKALRDEIARLTHERNVLRRLLERKEEFRGAPQVIVFLDIMGVIHAELPSTNGTRRKLELVSDFASRNPELLSELAAQRERQKQNNVTVRVTRTDAALEREKRIEAARVAHQRQWTERYNNASADEKARMDAAKAKATERSQERQHVQAREIWQQTATDHGINLANRVIPKQRRPNKKLVLSDGTTYNPKTERGDGKRRTKKYDPTLAINITL